MDIETQIKRRTQKKKSASSVLAEGAPSYSEPDRAAWSRVDEGLDESFPASDPVSAGTLEREAREAAQEA